jgi:hypothetical protein
MGGLDEFIFFVYHICSYEAHFSCGKYHVECAYLSAPSWLFAIISRLNFFYDDIENRGRQIVKN